MAGWESLRADLLRLREESPDAVPPGDWGLVIAVQTAEGHMWSAPLEITITP
ncbi:hypothetical protein ACIA58_13455 [Kribbella sp. NPDC051586]|uniref:hypothetical protein n=1 Tax=Kribbella sp. NPDC051586 TaxID=3364118 RepID=UPI00379D4014